jgi:peptidoglycan-associated lipoprotein
MPRLLIGIPLAVLTLGASQACATKNFVRSSVGDVNDKVEAVGRSVEQTQERTRRNEQKIAEVDGKVQAADQTARSAHAIATEAEQSVRATDARFDSRLQAMDKASKRLVYDLVLSEQEGSFRFGHAELPARAKTSIDGLIKQLKQDPKSIYIEIEGHTDNVGAPTVNRKVGLARAEAVQRYLYDQYHIPLHKMNVISYGGEKPVATNSTKMGRAQNRRVVIRIVA